eukprot:scaffold1727_cov133-Cylindrotheca_fusiformis.AAC.6
MDHLHVEQSLPICIALASIGGILEVAATAVTAIPTVREKQGIPVSTFWRWMAVATNVALQTISGFFSALFATWYGPVSIVVPFFYSSTLLSNMVIFGLFLGEEFNKPMQVGTHVIVLAVILLPVVGPTVSPEQQFDVLIKHWYSILWLFILLVVTLVTGGILILQASPDNTTTAKGTNNKNVFMTNYSPQRRRDILLLCRAASISIDLTVSRSLVLGPPNSFILASLIATKLISGNLYTYAIVVQSYAVEQAQFVPLNATMVIAVNAITGILIWEDEPQSWYGYICVFWLLGIGCDLLLSVPLLHAENPEFGTNMNASMLLQSTRKDDDIMGQHHHHQYQSIPNAAIVETNGDSSNGLTIITKQLSYNDDDGDDDGDSIVGLVSPQSGGGGGSSSSIGGPPRPRTRSTSFLSMTSTVSGREAWKDILSPARRLRTRSYDDYYTHMNYLWSPTTMTKSSSSMTPPLPNSSNSNSTPHTGQSEWAGLCPVKENSNMDDTPTRRNRHHHNNSNSTMDVVQQDIETTAMVQQQKQPTPWKTPR